MTACPYLELFPYEVCLCRKIRFLEQKIARTTATWDKQLIKAEIIMMTDNREKFCTGDKRQGGSTC